jgi:radical SAM protein with 4Fe4S-binding SPASM domain
MTDFTREELYSLSWQKPELAQIELTSRCNQNCVFCFSGDRVASTGKCLSLDDWKKIIDKLIGIGVRKIDFTGRENFLYPAFIPLLRWLKQQRIIISINTNGSVAIDASLDFTDLLIFSVHGLRETHDRIVRRKDSFSLVEKNIMKAAEKGVAVAINMTLVKQNWHQLLPVYRYFEKRCDLAFFSPTIPIRSLHGHHFDDCALEISKELLAAYAKKLKQIPGHKLVLKHGYHNLHINEPVHYTGPMFPLPNCAAGKCKLVVDHDGRVYPCHFFRDESFYCGNLLHEDAAKIWHQGQGFKKFRNLILDERIPSSCKSCLKKKRCFSGCKAWSEEYQQGGFDDTKDLRCELGSAFIRS